MGTYYVSLIVDATVTVTVEANSEEEAIEKAWGKAPSCEDAEIGDFTGEAVVSKDHS